MNNWGQLAVFDLETTGVDVETARIVSACVAVLAADGSVIARWDWLADPGIEIPDGAAAVHGITTERARAEGRPAHVVVAEITQSLRVLFALGIPLVVYNAPYDLTLLDRERRRHQLDALDAFSPVIDPLVIDKAVDRYRKGKRTLTATAELYHVALDDAHDAGSDAIAAGRVAQALGAAYPDELDITLPDLHGRQEVWYAEQAASFQDYIRSVKGDEGYIADSAWPMRPAEAPSSLLDTQPIPAPAPRPSLGVPTLDLYGTGVISFGLEPEPQSEPELHEPQVQPEPAVQAQPGPQAGFPAESDYPAQSDFPAEPAEPIVVIEELVVVEQHIDQVIVIENPGQGETGQGEADQAEARERDVKPAEAPEPDLDDTLTSGLPILVEPAFFEQHLAAAHSARSSRPTVLRVAAGIITDPAGRTLLVRKRGTTAFMQAGGKIESGESALDALSRELREEVGLVLDIDRTEYLGSFRAIAANEEDTVIRAEVFALSVTQEPQASGEIEELLWLESGDVSGIELAPLTRDTILPLWAERRSALF
ncbi:hypothetical protein BH11ACT4_BH11ACT4_18950 [soil metagenome]